MAMNDEETVALIVGGHTFGKCHGAVVPSTSARSPRAARSRRQGIGWKNTYGTGMGDDTLTSGLEGAWTNNPEQWDNGYLDNLYRYEWELTDEPRRRQAVDPQGSAAQGTVPDPTTRRSGTRR